MRYVFATCILRCRGYVTREPCRILLFRLALKQIMKGLYQLACNARKLFDACDVFRQRATDRQPWNYRLVWDCVSQIKSENISGTEGMDTSK